MKLNQALKDWAVKMYPGCERLGDQGIRQQIGVALVKGVMTPSKFKELVSIEATGTITDQHWKTLLLTAEKLKELAAQNITTAKEGQTVTTKTTTPKPKASAPASTLFGKAGVGSLSTKRVELKLKNGEPMRFGPEGMERTLTTASEHDTALVGLWVRHRLRQSGVPGLKPLNENEKGMLLDSAGRDGGWGGDFGGRYYDRANPLPLDAVKAVLDDTTSGGQYVNPIQFDEQVITYPLLNSELVPFVDLKQITGRRWETAAIGNPTISWSVAEGSAITPLTTTSLITQLNGNIYPATGALELGRDLLDDSPVALGAKFLELYGIALKADLERVIINGNGTSEPTGILSATGMATVNSDNGPSGPFTVSDVETLIRACPKQYRADKSLNPRFIMADTTYWRMRGIAVGPGDERRVFGMDHEQYTLLGHGVSVNNAGAISNGKVLFGLLKKFRLYQRLGLSLEMSTEGRTLMLSNLAIIVCRSRWGGRVMDGAGFSYMSDGMS